MLPAGRRSRYHRPVRAATSLWLLLFLSGCAHDDHQAQYAGRTVSMGWQVIADAERILEEAEPAEDREPAKKAVEAAKERFHRAEGVVRIWQDTGTGSLGWYTLAPCLGAALDRIRDRFVEAELELPGDWDQAREMARVASDGRCAERTNRQ